VTTHLGQAPPRPTEATLARLVTAVVTAAVALARAVGAVRRPGRGSGKLGSAADGAPPASAGGAPDDG
jgi:hypothetical protein